jgi:serine/threonine protein kinase
MTPVPELEAERAAAPTTPGHTLPLGSRLREYEVTRLIGEGNTSIVYLGWDHAAQRQVVIKEYMPASMVGRVRGSAQVVVAAERHADVVKAGLKGFLHEAGLLARFDHPSLVKVHAFWEANGTAYMAMPHYEGPTLKAVLAELGQVPSEAELRAWLRPVLNAVTLLHEHATWHQNIGPDEILLTPAGPVLLGLATAAHTIQAIHHTPAAALKPGFAAIEQYGSEAGSTRGPWTDLYALGAVMYAAITGSDPVPAADRLAQDRLRPLSIVAAGLYSKGFLAAIDAAMAVQPKRRPADHTEFRALMGDIDAPEAVPLAPRPDLMQEPFAPARPGPAAVAPDRRQTMRAVAAPPAVAANDETARSEPAPRPALPALAGLPVPPAGVESVKPVEPVHAMSAAPAGPSWMKRATARGLGNRALYGVVAGSFALIGIAALVVQFASRPTPRPGLASPAVATSTPARAAAASAGAAALPPSPVAAVAAPPKGPAPTPAPIPPKGAAPVAPATTLAGATSAATPDERHSRCTEILQKASLEKITAAETEFFKRECK